MTKARHSSQDIAEEIFRQHAVMLAGEAQPYAQVVDVNDSLLDTITAGILQGCRMLGFLEHDAQCVGKAWQQQTRRTGEFSTTHWPCDPQDFGISTLPSSLGFPSCPKALGLYAVLPDAQWIGRMARAGVPTLQLRFKSSDNTAVRQEVRAAVQAVKDTNALLFINDHWQIAIDEGAYGVHLGQEDMDEAPLEKIRAAGLRLGLSTHGYAEMLRADAVHPSYIAIGAVFPTTLKRMKTAPQGTGRLFAYAKLMQHNSLVAIGGIDEARIPTVMRSGVGSIAMVRAIVAASHPELEVVKLKSIMKSHQTSTS